MFGRRVESIEKIIRLRLESVNVQVEKSILLVDKGVSNMLASLYSFEQLQEKFQPLLFQTLPLPPDPPVKLTVTSKIVIMVSSFLWDQWDLIRRTIHQLHFPQSSPRTPHPTLTVTVYCGVSEDSHQNIRPDFAPSNTTAYNFARKDLEQVFQDMKLRENAPHLGTVIISVKHLPSLGLNPLLLGDLILSPGGRNLFPAGLTHIDPETMELVEESLSAEWKEQISLNVSTVTTLLGMAGVPVGKAHFWALGSSAKYMGHLLSNVNYPSFDQNANYADAGVIIVDRTMDLVAPTAHSDHLIHRILSVLPARESPSDDVHIDMVNVFENSIPSKDSALEVETGRLFESQEDLLLSELIGLKHKDALIALRKKLVDVITEEEISVNISSMMRGAVNIKQLESFVKVFRENAKLIYKYSSLLQFIEAALLALQRSKTLYWDQLLSTEKVIQLNAMSENAESIAKQLTDMLLHPIPGSHSYYPVYMVLQLAIFAYSLCGTQSSHLWEDEGLFKEALAEAIVLRPQNDYSMPWLGRDLNKRVEEYHSNTEISAATKKSIAAALKMEVIDKLEEAEILDKLHSFRIYRRGLEDYNTLLIQKGTSCQYKSQISQILEHIYHPDKPALQDLKLIQSSLSGLLRSGLGRIGLKSKPHPSNHSLLIIFVLGGISMPEMKEIQDACKAKKQRVIIVSNRICNAADIYSQVFERQQ